MADIVFYSALVLRETPPWVYAVLAILILLGVRRLRTRSRSLLSASVAPGVFLIWSVSSAFGFGASNGGLSAAALWGLSLIAGLASFRLVPPSPVRRISPNAFSFQGTIRPLVFYLSVFVARYGLGVWAGFQPDRAVMASAIALAISGFTAGRTAGDFIFLIGLPLRSHGQEPPP